MQRGAVAGAFRTIPFKILTLRRARPAAGRRRARARSRAAWSWSPGPTGSGKSTTLASMIDKINTERARAHHHDRGSDRVPAPAQELRREPARGRRRHRALQERAQVHPAPGPGRRAGRRDARPRDDRGGADHRRDRPPRASPRCTPTRAVQTINRIIDVFPPHQQPQVRAQLSFVLEGVMSPDAAAARERARAACWRSR